MGDDEGPTIFRFPQLKRKPSRSLLHCQTVGSLEVHARPALNVTDIPSRA